MQNIKLSRDPSRAEKAAEYYGYNPQFSSNITPSPLQFRASQFATDFSIEESSHQVILEFGDNKIVIYISDLPGSDTITLFDFAVCLESRTDDDKCDFIAGISGLCKDGEIDLSHRIVDPRFRNRGIFRYLLNIILKHASKNRLRVKTTTLMLHTALSFKALGFEIESASQKQILEEVLSGSDKYTLRSARIGTEDTDYVITKSDEEEHPLSHADAQVHPCSITLTWTPEELHTNDALDRIDLIHAAILSQI
jgi:GNAT superfamily N-acetyltransferase